LSVCYVKVFTMSIYRQLKLELSIINCSRMLCVYLHSSDGSGSGQFFVAWVWSGWYGFGKFPLKNPKFFNFFPLGHQKTHHRVGSKGTWVKDRSDSYLLQVKSVLGLVRVRAHLYYIHLGLYFFHTIQYIPLQKG